MGCRPALRVTFDTNVLDLACRPTRSPKDPRQPLMQKVHDALANGKIEGFYSVTMLTIEGIMRRDRAGVFAGTRTVMQPEARQIIRKHRPAGCGPGDSWQQGSGNYFCGTSGPAAGPATAAPRSDRSDEGSEGLGFKVLKDVPRIGAFHFKDPTGEYYLKPGEGAELEAWVKKAIEVAQAIEAQGIGFAQVKSLGEDMAASDPGSAWFRLLDQVTDVHQERAVERAFSEWADGGQLGSPRRIRSRCLLL